MSLPLDPNLPARYVLRDDAKPADDTHWFWPLPRLAGESPRIIAHAHDDRLGVDVGYGRITFNELFVPVFAARGGTISFAARVTSGYAVTIDHGVWSTHYAHLEQMFVASTLGRRRRRRRVRTGDVIGYAGREPNHIRFEVWHWTSRDGFTPVEAAQMMDRWRVLPQFTVSQPARGAGAAA
ncbi:MAG TPA: peptidoglycan DD-metalloendopeptidase family protein [Kofleriaceae bacterium]